jgi:hypothetical protein
MPFMPAAREVNLGGENCWLIDWSELFEGGVKRCSGARGGEMRNFHVVFRIRIHTSGTLIFWDDDGSIIRRAGRIVHTDRTVHPLKRNEIDVNAGDELEIAQWQSYGEWKWAARLEPTVRVNATAQTILAPYLPAVRKRLRKPNGPVLKVFTSGSAPARAILGIYSMVLNGYLPAEVILYGEHQWNDYSRQLFRDLLPFARVVPTNEFIRSLASFGLSHLTEWARAHWFVMKTCLALLHPPEESCLFDDDLFVLRPIDDALDAFAAGSQLVFTPDADYTGQYLNTWGRILGVGPALPTARFNAGLYFLRRPADPCAIIRALLQVPPQRIAAMDWEQGFIACWHAKEKFTQLSGQRYFFPYLDGLPGGFLGYDYQRNPCGFTTVHFCGLNEKPSDADALLLADAILQTER